MTEHVQYICKDRGPLALYNKRNRMLWVSDEDGLFTCDAGDTCYSLSQIIDDMNESDFTRIYPGDTLVLHFDDASRE